ncbi:hypothetical protein A0H76_2844 [Hepatospora eriocheir]|uniref:Uncharacterized protein n=1 Tax=Hepatospora eriocheir TaxID=1081669 RepID=A0A1X0Q5M5_9MICR|nr:hypothetical protein A0H76_2844 [Hepatospora eriocheir]
MLLVIKEINHNVILGSCILRLCGITIDYQNECVTYNIKNNFFCKNNDVTRVNEVNLEGKQIKESLFYSSYFEFLKNKNDDLIMSDTLVHKGINNVIL